MKDDKLYYFTT